MSVADYNLNLNGGADNCGSGASVGYQAQRDSIILGGSGNTLTANTSIAYNVGARARPKLLITCGPLFYASCGRGEPEPRLNIGISATLSGISPAWVPLVSFRATAQPNGPCKATIFNFHLENDIANAVQNGLNNSAGAAQTAVANAINLPANANKAWALLSAPISLAPSVWLTANPQQIGFQPFVVTPAGVDAGLYLQAMPVLTYGSKPPSPPVPPLPPPSSVPTTDSYFLSVPVQSDYATLNRQVQAALKLEAGGIRYPPSGSNYLTVTGADIYAYGQKMALRLDLKVHGVFGKRAVVYLTGTPTFASSTNVISFPDLEFTLESKNVLAKLAVWLEQGNIQNDLRSRLSYDLTPYVNQAKAKMLAELNQTVGAASLKGTVDTINVLGLYTDPSKNTFSAYLQTSGSLDITIH